MPLHNISPKNTYYNYYLVFFGFPAAVLSPFCSCLLSSASCFPFIASTTDPTSAASRSTEATSKGSAYFENKILEKSNQDFLDLQSEPGVLILLPNWVSRIIYYYSSEINADIFILDELGEYSVYLYRYNEPKHIWICPPVQVVE